MMKATNCSSTLSDAVAVEENGSTLTPHYMTGNESLNVSKMEKGETNYDSAENKKLEGNNVIYDESDGAHTYLKKCLSPVYIHKPFENCFRL